MAPKKTKNFRCVACNNSCPEPAFAKDLCKGHYNRRLKWGADADLMTPIRPTAKGNERVNWKNIIPIAAEIVTSYSTGVTLRQLFYRLVAEGHIPNRPTAYQGLSSHTAEARRYGGFPDLIDRTREVVSRASVASVQDALKDTVENYALNRTNGQKHQIWLVVEKHALYGLLEASFLDYGVYLVALGGYSSQTLKDDIASTIQKDGRPSVLIYAGDHDPSGDWEVSGSIPSDLRGWVHFDQERSVALSHDQVVEFNLPEAFTYDKDDTRIPAFRAIYGSVVQFELDALPPDVLTGLYADALAEFWDEQVYQNLLRDENAQQEHLRRMVDTFTFPPTDWGRAE